LLVITENFILTYDLKNTKVGQHTEKIILFNFTDLEYVRVDNENEFTHTFTL
jgi:hypothetical protein